MENKSKNKCFVYDVYGLKNEKFIDLRLLIVGCDIWIERVPVNDCKAALCINQLFTSVDSNIQNTLRSFFVEYDNQVPWQ